MQLQVRMGMGRKTEGPRLGTAWLWGLCIVCLEEGGVAVSAIGTPRLAVLPWPSGVRIASTQRLLEIAASLVRSSLS